MTADRSKDKDWFPLPGFPDYEGTPDGRCRSRKRHYRLGIPAGEPPELVPRYGRIRVRDSAGKRCYTNPETIRKLLAPMAVVKPESAPMRPVRKHVSLASLVEAYEAAGRGPGPEFNALADALAAWGRHFEHGDYCYRPILFRDFMRERIRSEVTTIEGLKRQPRHMRKGHAVGGPE